MPAQTRRARTTLPTPPVTAADILAAKKPRQQSVALVADDALLDAYQDAGQAWQAAVIAQHASRANRIRAHLATAGTPEAAVAAVDADEETALTPARAALDAARAALNAGTLVFTFRSLGRTRFNALRDEHPAGDADHDDVRETAGPQARAAWHAETFLPALIQASCISPALTDDDVASMFESEAWTDAELGVLTAAALAVHMQASTPPPDLLAEILAGRG